MQRKFIFRGGSKELVLPVTPDSYRVDTGRNIEIVNIHGLGDAAVAGYGTLATIAISCLLPASDYPFSRSEKPDPYISQLKKWAEAATKLRFIVGGTGVNIPVLLQNIAWGERDGTNDVYAELTLREYRTLKTVKTASTAAAGKPREPVVKTSSASVTEYTAKYGDTLCSICRKYYGNDSPTTYQKLAAYNGKPNPNLLMAGEVLKIPQPL